MKPRRKFVSRCSASCRARISPWRVLAASCALSAGALSALPVFAAQSAKPSPAIPQKSAATQAPVVLANQPPTAATISFQNGKLTIKAHNSELLQILQAVTAQTGMKVQGSPGSHRIFGTYGPGQPREILSELLSGFDFNYLLVGTAHNGAPQKLILAGTPASGPQPSQPANSIQPAPQNTLPQPQPGPRPNYQPPPNQPSPRVQVPSNSPRQPQGAPSVRTPQQILKELEAMHAQQKQNSSH